MKLKQNLDEYIFHHQEPTLNDINNFQIGRTAWMKNKEGHCEYPALAKLKEVEKVQQAIDLSKTYQPKSLGSFKEFCQFHAKPLEGYVVVDFTNVLSGPNCGRMLCELGKIDLLYPLFLHNLSKYDQIYRRHGI